MDSQKWRNPSLKACGLCGRQWPTERLELVERLIEERKKNRALSDLLRSYERSWTDEAFDLNAIQARWETDGIPGVRAELVKQGITVPRRQTRAVIEMLGHDPAEIRALILDRQTLTVVTRDERAMKYLIMEDQ